MEYSPESVVSTLYDLPISQETSLYGLFYYSSQSFPFLIQPADQRSCNDVGQCVAGFVNFIEIPNVLSLLTKQSMTASIFNPLAILERAQSVKC